MNSTALEEPDITRSRTNIREFVALILTALACNACCWLPPLILAVGGAGAGLAEFLHPYRPYLLVLMVVQLGWGFRNAYRSHDTCSEHACIPRNTRIALMWGIAVVVVGLNLVPDTHHRPATHLATHTRP